MSLMDTLNAQTPPLHVDRDGVVRVGGTRVTLDTLIEMYESGAAPEEIVQAYDTLQLADVHSAISHYLRHRREVQDYLSQRRGRAMQIREANQERQERRDIRERLMARLQKGG